LSPGENNFLLAVNERDDQLGSSFLDISTGEFRAAQFSGADRWNRLLLDVEHLAPREVLFPNRMKDAVEILEGIAKTSVDDWLFDADYASRTLRDQLGAATLDGFGLKDKPVAVGAAGALVHYVKQTQKTTLEHITSLTVQETANYLLLDPASIRNLELIQSSDGDTKDTLLGVINRTSTGMGARLLRSWLLRPSIDPAEIEARLDAVSEVVPSALKLESIRSSFEGIFDLERLLGKITVGTSTPRELTS